ncbi:N,N-dimethylformamidase beta subunit family domain-containing protein [Rufibacter psychrotolerans]|uniref:N,N-dimethylformamidase beta subunit family domain-containing protein n=1 Tax=Rufibacter psychrotolerans TaxID=2812556 RepID=UPI001967A7F5|nr:N,N-dimethylformamidase beta subunit family domain-containing protein [Rufibacter sp. SYSU D00308]
MKVAKRAGAVFRRFLPILLQTVGPLKHLLWRLRLRPLPAADQVTPDMVPQPLEGYSDRLYYKPGETVSFHLRALQPHNQLFLQRSIADGEWEDVARHTFQELPQPEALDEAQHGCNWTIGWQFTLPPHAPAGYYRALLTNPALKTAAEIHFLVGAATATGKVAVLAPVTTWLAYNAYGGQSLYRNAIYAGYVPFVSALRPNTALTYHGTSSLQHNLRIEANIFHWFSQHHQADLYPDYYLEAHPELFKDYQVLVLAYHAEYFSEKMYQALRELVLQDKKSLVALGGNQVYWQVRWHQHFTQVECRKNGRFFQNETKRGGLWRHTPQPEAQLLGAQFSEPGMGTYAPYQVLAPDHWLLEGTGTKAGDLFGQQGVDGRPLCGDETDKACWCSPAASVVIAKGLNPAQTDESGKFAEGDPTWDGSGGGEITVTELSPRHAVLHTGSIQSGAGLGLDAVFTQLVQNFMQRYGRTSTGGTTCAETVAAPAPVPVPAAPGK